MKSINFRDSNWVKESSTLFSPSFSDTKALFILCAVKKQLLSSFARKWNLSSFLPPLVLQQVIILIFIQREMNYDALAILIAIKCGFKIYFFCFLFARFVHSFLLKINISFEHYSGRYPLKIIIASKFWNLVVPNRFQRPKYIYWQTHETIWSLISEKMNAIDIKFT